MLKSPEGLMSYLTAHNIWHQDYGHIRQGTGQWIMVTGGWSGNEDIIDAMRCNTMLWMLYWCSSERGGRYIFEDWRKQ